MTVGWRKLPPLFDPIQDHFRFRIGDGATCSLWFNRWSISRPLAAIVSNRDIHRAGFNLYSKVKDAVHNGEWSWPADWFSKYPLFNSVDVPTFSAMHDRLEWRDRLDIVKPFSVNAVWNSSAEDSKTYLRPWMLELGFVVSFALSSLRWTTDSHEASIFDCVFPKQILGFGEVLWLVSPM
ncbi:hypothetical protein Tco_0278262 [Tanacetum coccineum]